MKRELSSGKLPIGSSIPQFSLKNIDESVWSPALAENAKALLVVFTCNHCPYVKGSKDELISLAKRFGPEGLAVVTINSNDPVQYPEDSFTKMKEKAIARRLPYPYLFDESQLVAKLFNAACTPECDTVRQINHLNRI